MLTKPTFIPSNLSDAPLDFPWDNGIAVSLSDPDEQPARLVEAVWKLNYKAKAALALCCLEWVLWRLDGPGDVGDPLQRIEAAWASTLQPAYSNSLDFDDVRDDVHQKGNPAGPRQTVLNLLDDWHFALTKSRTALEWATVKAAHLGSLTLPTSSGYEAWLQRTISALASAFPCSKEFDHSARTFDHSAERAIPRAWFESLTVPPDAAADRAAWDTFLRNLDPTANPYLVPADEMRAAGFVGEPYRSR
ncbi:hypothetical protein [Rhizobacter sp. SG703]|uniref:hypothetical protein n=1 Tax=Rhizobacter sp. SG703 TaxID=2587140 RepID=UPI001446303C|nr:hypothetical protein [Rhizobacter sp. SG703]NKI94695.1 hypothetical protein [Rhizobacter sp. SG703]